MQFLQGKGVVSSPAAANGSNGRIGSSPTAYPEGGDAPDSTAGKRFADLLHARLGEERHVQVTLLVVVRASDAILLLCVGLDTGASTASKYTCRLRAPVELSAD